ncbi:MAG: hypothetical protein BJ554DRAFT_300 [Olpidium bornovanus]|uniref:Uncharacterized protein n=1 Tax=Olpidium bornovanus TaxID=278681 RepID=A0A8H8DI88_9FUNG|nr:MAG: hypothetical protein BJ554DRAFT_300 [Olpidium bornovanus]
MSAAAGADAAPGGGARGSARHAATEGNGDGPGRRTRNKLGDSNNGAGGSSSCGSIGNANLSRRVAGGGGGARRSRPQQFGPEPFASSFRSFLPVASDDDNDEEDDSGGGADAGPPASGEDYLRWVRRQAARCPDVVTVPLDRSKVRKSTRPLPGREEEEGSRAAGPQRDTPPPLPPPSAEWESRFLEAFRERGKSLRRYVSDRVNEEDKSRAGLPGPKDMNSWRSFLYGQGKPCGTSCRGSEREPAEDGGGGGGGDDDDQGLVVAVDGGEVGEPPAADGDDRDPVSGEDEGPWADGPDERDEGEEGAVGAGASAADEEVPAVESLSVSSALDDRSASGGAQPTLRLLAKFDQARWIFAVLSRLDPLLEASEVAVLRDLCRECLKLRARLVGAPVSSRFALGCALKIRTGTSRRAVVRLETGY